MCVVDKVFSMTKRLSPDDRTAQILEAAIEVASKGHYRYLTRREIAEAAGVTGPLVGHYLGPMDELGAVLMGYAVANAHLCVLAQGLRDQHPIALLATEELKVKARGVVGW